MLYLQIRSALRSTLPLRLRVGAEGVFRTVQKFMPVAGVDIAAGPEAQVRDVCVYVEFSAIERRNAVLIPFVFWV